MLMRAAAYLNAALCLASAGLPSYAVLAAADLKHLLQLLAMLRLCLLQLI